MFTRGKLLYKMTSGRHLPFVPESPLLSASFRPVQLHPHQCTIDCRAMPLNSPHTLETVHSSPAACLPPMSALAKPSSPRPGPSILLNPYCRSTEGVRAPRSTSRLTQLSGALRALIFNPASGDPGSRDPDASTFHDRGKVQLRSMNALLEADDR